MKCEECRYCVSISLPMGTIDLKCIVKDKIISGERGGKYFPPWCPLLAVKQEDTNGMYPKKKPPLGLMPRTLWLDMREQEVKLAIQRYLDEGFEIPVQWVEEYNELSHPREKI